MTIHLIIKKSRGLAKLIYIKSTKIICLFFLKWGYAKDLVWLQQYAWEYFYLTDFVIYTFWQLKRVKIRNIIYETLNYLQ